MITSILIGAALHINQPKSLDINKLAYAVRMQGTHDCSSKNSSARYHNCYGIMAKRGSYQTFKTNEESTKRFKEIWLKHYMVFPTLKQATKWSSPRAAKTWLKNVTYYYERGQTN